MADLHRYDMRVQYDRCVSIDAVSETSAKALGIIDTEDAGGVKIAIAKTATLVQENVGMQGPLPLHRYDVDLKIIRDVIIDAEDYEDAEFFAKADIDTFGGNTADQRQGVRLIKQKTGTA